MASEIFQTEINSLFDKFFEAPPEPEPELPTEATAGENDSSGDDQEYQNTSLKSAVMLESEDEVI